MATQRYRNDVPRVKRALGNIVYILSDDIWSTGNEHSLTDPWGIRLNMLCASAWAAVLAGFILGRQDRERMSKAWLKGR
jgi:hypothetical protein